eukprot:scaffold54288_cov61-Cyclotella_meneghiniana.AAC.4
MPVSSHPDGICTVPGCQLRSDLCGVFSATPPTPAIGREIDGIYPDQGSAAGDWHVRLEPRSSDIRTPRCRTTEPC